MPKDCPPHWIGLSKGFFNGGTVLEWSTGSRVSASLANFLESQDSSKSSANNPSCYSVDGIGRLANERCTTKRPFVCAMTPGSWSKSVIITNITSCNNNILIVAIIVMSITILNGITYRAQKYIVVSLPDSQSRGTQFDPWQASYMLGACQACYPFGVT